MNLPSIVHPTDRPNFAIVHLPNVTLAFSYETCIAFRAQLDWMVRENDWSATTGKHLNYLDAGNKADRLPSEEFESQLRDQLMTRLPTGEYV